MGELDGFMTTDEAAAELGIQPVSLRQLARRRGVGTVVGTGQRRTWFFSPDDVEALRSRKVGRPPKVTS